MCAVAAMEQLDVVAELHRRGVWVRWQPAADLTLASVYRARAAQAIALHHQGCAHVASCLIACLPPEHHCVCLVIMACTCTSVYLPVGDQESKTFKDNDANLV